jgi:hypothetical protein
VPPEEAAEVAKRPYDLEHGPLLRPGLVRFADDHHRLYLAMHHLIFDGVTLYRVLLPELVALYDAFAAGKSSPLPEPVVQYGDYAEWEQAWVSSPVVRRRMEYWRSHLSGAPSLEFPLDHPRPPVQRFCGQVEEIAVGADVASGLRSLAQQSRRQSLPGLWRPPLAWFSAGTQANKTLCSAPWPTCASGPSWTRSSATASRHSCSA